MGSIEQPQPYILIEQVLKLMRICFELMGTITTFYGFIFKDIIIGLSPLMLVYDLATTSSDVSCYGHDHIISRGENLS